MKMGFYFDMTVCIGCRTCQIVCKDKNDLNVGILYRRVRSFETGEYPDPGFYHYSSSCNHCRDPKCVKSCPTKAMATAKDGTVQHDPEICLRCQNCVKKCPYGVPQYFELEEKIGKCDACKDLRDEGKNPVCVDACVMRALKWGNLSELKEMYSERVLVSDLPILPPSEITTPSLIITPKEKALNRVYVRVKI